MGKKKKKDPSAILQRAESLFAKGSWLAAKREFEKAAKLVGPGEIVGKLAVCDGEIAKQKAKDLIKKGRKCLAKNDPGQALACFEKAHEATGEAWLEDKIGRLRTQLHGQNALESAADLETAGRFAEAAESYGRAWDLEGRDELLFKKAHCLVRAAKYEDAIAIFKDNTPVGRTAKYDYGFALAKTGKFDECLKIWRGISETDQPFAAQIDSVRQMLVADLFACFKAGADIGEIYGRGLILRETGAWDQVRELVEYVKLAQIEKLCEDGHFEAALGLLAPYPDDMPPEYLALCAKIHYRLAETGQYLDEFAMFWLTALYHPEVYEKLSPDPNQREAARRKLLEDAEALIRQNGNGDHAEKALAGWKLQEQAVKNVAMIAGKKNAHLAMAPKFAEKFGKSGRIVRMLANKKAEQKDFRAGLEAGMAYSCAGKSMWLLEYGEYEEAANALPAPEAVPGEEAEFVAFATEIVNFKYGVHQIENGVKPDKRFCGAAIGLFEKMPESEEKFACQAIDAEEGEVLEAFEAALEQILAKYSTGRLKEALSLTMTRRGISESNEGRLNRKALAKTIEKALKLNPGNELARATQKSLGIENEYEELDKALYGHKMGKACRIAANSENEEIRDAFFDFMETILGRLEKSDWDRSEKLIYLESLGRWSYDVDPFHPIIDRIDLSIELMEKNSEKN